MRIPSHGVCATWTATGSAATGALEPIDASDRAEAVKKIDLATPRPPLVLITIDPGDGRTKRLNHLEIE
jgi:hypothetical protein